MEAKHRPSFDTHLSKSYWAWRSNPALSIPSIMANSLSAVYYSIIGIFVVAFTVQLQETGLLNQIIQLITSYDSGVFHNLVHSPVFWGIILETMVPAFILMIIIGTVTNGFVASAEFGSYWKALGGSRIGISEVLASLVDAWKPMAWTLLLSYTLTFLPFIGALAFTALIIVFQPVVPGLVFVLLLAYLAAGVATPLLALFFIFTPVVVVSDRLSGLSAIRRSVVMVGSAKKTGVTYSLIYIFLTILVSTTPSIIPGIGMPLVSLATMGLLIIVVPVLHLTKASVYRELSQQPSETKEALVFYEPVLPDLTGKFPRYAWKVLRAGLVQVKRYTLEMKNVPYHLASIASITVGWLLGLWVARNGLTQAIYALGYVPGRINPELGQNIPLSLGTYIFLHNWQVSLAMGVSGTWFSFSTVLSLLLNGVIIGVVSDLIPNTTMLLAGLLPHGVIEIPSFLIAGSAGIKLGVNFLRWRRNPREGTKFEAAFRQTIYLLFGLAFLFLIAGVIEGVVTPQIMRLTGWT